MPSKTLIFIPTYNERDNAPRMCEEIHKLGLDADVLFVDDNSPDGTGDVLDGMKGCFPRLTVLHRSGKLGIGSAHFEAIEWAYDQGYQVMVTLDCDFTHSPSDIPAMIAAAENCDVSVGSRWLLADSLPGWNFFRRSITNLGHLLTHRILGVPQDASGAFRAYRLDRIPRGVFALVKTRGYSFFFESLFILNRNGFAITEVPIVLPVRTYGHSKMSAAAALGSARYIFELFFAHLRRPEAFLLERCPVELNPDLEDTQDWNSYWSARAGKRSLLYDLIAGIYRRGIIKSNLERAIHKNFPSGSALLHAGCGSGQVDANLQKSMNLTALDISSGALRLYARNNPRAIAVKHGSIFCLPFPNGTFDGVYNLGVMEHFTRAEITQILSEFHRVLKPDGKILLFWPHAHASSVYTLIFMHFFFNRILKKQTKLHPSEISYISSKKEAARILAECGFTLASYQFGLSDFFVQAIIVGEIKNSFCLDKS
jgi:dolichol-phosphate mannosyltransferase